MVVMIRRLLTGCEPCYFTLMALVYKRVLCEWYKKLCESVNPILTAFDSNIPAVNFNVIV